jgi:predicted MFS family arabinose efflux permease
MAAATLMPAGLGILAPYMRDDLGVSRTQIGMLITTVTIGAALISPLAGRITDILGGRRSIVLLFTAAIAGFAGISIVPGYGWMLLPVAIAAIAQAGGNPITNKLIALHTARGRRGVVTGIKQSGVQVGVFLGGVLLPLAAEVWGWRWAFAFVVVVPLVGLALTAITLPSDRPVRRQADSRERDRLPGAIVYLAVYGGLMGFGAAYTFLVPLFAEEALGMSERAGGLAAGLVGFVALFSRIAWSRYADIKNRSDATLAILAVGSVGAAGVFLIAQSGASWLLWVGAILTGVTSSSWNSVGMLSTIEHSGHDQSGRASGAVMLGFLTGLGVAPTVFGRLVDVTESYTPMWLSSIAALSLASALSLWWLHHANHRERDA